jgi:hypothetical protein
VRWLCSIVAGALYVAHWLIRFYWLDHRSDGWFQRGLGGWWERTFPPREAKEPRGFEVKLQQTKQDAGEPPVPHTREKDNDHG